MQHARIRRVAGRSVAALARLADVSVVALAVATLLGLVCDAVRPGAAVHALWMGSTGTPGLDAWLAVAFGVLVLGRRRLASRWARATRVFGVVTGLLVAGVTCAALVRHGEALADGSLGAGGLWPPVTLFALVLVLRWTCVVALEPAQAPPRNRAAVRLARLAGAGALLAFCQIAATGATDYRAPADAIVVLGARVHADGRPSGALQDRVRTAFALWRAGLAPVLVLSGGRGAGAPVSEPLAMATLALAEGVPPEALVLDEGGADTESSVAFAARTASARGWRRVLVVSHDYHLARVRLLAGRAGLVVRTVPAAETQPRGWKVAAVGREVAAYAAEWFLGLAADEAVDAHLCGGA